jgi:hypothetical protein
VLVATDGASGPQYTPPLMLIVPLGMRRPTFVARSRSAPNTPPERPEIELLAMRTASSSSSYGMSVSTAEGTSRAGGGAEPTGDDLRQRRRYGGPLATPSGFSCKLTS